MIRIVSSKYITSAVKYSAYPPTLYPDFAFVGRSNVGKSSMINTLTGRKLLAKIANKPGKTRLINFFQCQAVSIDDGQLTIDTDSAKSFDTPKEPDLPQADHFSEIAISPQAVSAVSCQFSIGLVDLPGYGFARVSKAEREQWQRMINEFFHKRQQLTGVIVLVDIRHDADPKDVVMIDMLKALGKDFMIAATKCDKIPKGKVPSALKHLANAFDIASVRGEQGGGICEFSSHTKVGVDKLLTWIETKSQNSVLNNRVIVH